MFEASLNYLKLCFNKRPNKRSACTRHSPLYLFPFFEARSGSLSWPGTHYEAQVTPILLPLPLNYWNNIKAWATVFSFHAIRTDLVRLSLEIP